MKIGGLENNNETLNNILHNKEQEVFKKAQEYTEEYNAIKLKEEDSQRYLVDDREKTITLLESDYVNKKNNLDKRMEEVFSKEAQEYKNYLSIIELELEKRKNQIKSQEEDLDTYRISLEKELENTSLTYDKILADLIAKNAAQKEKTVDIINEYEKRISNLNSELDQAKLDGNALIEEKISEYNSEIERIKSFYNETKTKYLQAIKNTKDDIATLNLQKKGLIQEYEELISSYDNKRIDTIDKL